MDLDNEILAEQMLKTIVQFHKIRLKQLNSKGQNRSELMVLMCIKKSEQHEIKVSDISTRLNVKTPTVTQIINKLEAKRQIERINSSEDRRSVLIRLTQEGERVSEQAEKDILEVYRGLVEYLGEKESIHLINSLSEVFNYFSEKAQEELTC